MKLTSNNFEIHRSGASGKSANIPAFGGVSVQRVANTVCDTGILDSFTSAGKKIIKKASNGPLGAVIDAGCRGAKFLKENLITGTDVTYSNGREILDELKKNFGDTFVDCFDDIEKFNDISQSSIGSFTNRLRSKLHIGGQKQKFKYSVFTMNEAGEQVIHNTPFSKELEGENVFITFHKDSFLKNVFWGIKEFTLGSLMDVLGAARGALRKASVYFGKNDIAASTKHSAKFYNTVLDNRVIEKEARDSFYKLTGVFESVKNGVDMSAKEGFVTADMLNSGQRSSAITNTIRNLAHDSMASASSKVGRYNTKTERAWNRLGTGFVSATFAATDFYNISMLQNNDPEKANESGRKRFLQDMRRQGLTAGITYVILGAFQKKTNSSLLYASLSLGGVTLISEILSRLIGGISLKPLSPEEAATIAKTRKKKDKTIKTDVPRKTITVDGPFTKIAGSFKKVSDKENNLDVFNVYTDKILQCQNSTAPAFMANRKPENKENENLKKPKEKKSGGVVSKILKVLGAIVGITLTVGFLRSKNVLDINKKIEDLSGNYKKLVKKFTQKNLVLSKDDVDGFLDYLKENNFNEQYSEISKLLERNNHSCDVGTAKDVMGKLPVREINSKGLYYDFGLTDSRGKKMIAGLLLYPINMAGRVAQKVNNVVMTLFGITKKQEQAENDEGRKMALAFLEKYVNKYKNASIKNELGYSFRKEIEDAFSRHFSEANSQNKNTSVAMASRSLVTLISSYFFVNDYRNEVLIESEGKDVERANATVKERIGHKIANFFFNSFFMDLFNSLFEGIYLSSVTGATAVAMATEVTNETAVRASICSPTKKMSREELIEYENTRLNDDGFKGKYSKVFMKITGKKPLSEKAKS